MIEGVKLPDKDVDVETLIESQRKNFLENFPFELQASLFKALGKRVGIPDPNLIGPDRIFNYEGDGIATYMSNPIYEREFIGIKFKRLLNFETDPEKRMLLTWHLFNHEQVHAATAESRGQVGYQTSMLPYFSLWNEGVTEKLAQEVTKELYIATGYGSTKIRDSIYEKEVQFVNFFVKKISEAVGINETTVWQAVVKGIFDRVFLFDKEFQALFA